MNKVTFVRIFEKYITETLFRLWRYSKYPEIPPGEIVANVIVRPRETRVESSLRVLIWGLDAQGLRFAQGAIARNISGSGALLSGVERQLRPGDLIGLQYGACRAHFRVVWTRESGNGEKIRVAVHRLETENCPWQEELNPADPHHESDTVRKTGADLPRVESGI